MGKVKTSMPNKLRVIDVLCNKEDTQQRGCLTKFKEHRLAVRQIATRFLNLNCGFSSEAISLKSDQ